MPISSSRTSSACRRSCRRTAELIPASSGSRDAAARRDHLLRHGAHRDRRARPAHPFQHRPGAADRPGDVRLHLRASRLRHDREQSGDYAEDLAATMLASTLGIEFDPNAAWNERKNVYQTSNLIFGSTVDHRGGRRRRPTAAGPARSRRRCSASPGWLAPMSGSPTFATAAELSRHCAPRPRCAGLHRRHSVRYRHHQPQRRALRPGRDPAGEPHAGRRRPSALVDRSGRRRRWPISAISRSRSAISRRACADRGAGRRLLRHLIALGGEHRHHAAAAAGAGEAARRPAGARAFRRPCRHLARQFRPGVTRTARCSSTPSRKAWSIRGA